MAIKKYLSLEKLTEYDALIKEKIDSGLATKANSSHNHAASNITSGTLSSDRLPTVPISKGGTGATTAAGALTNLGVTATAAELNKLDGVTATTAELNYVDGVTSNIQTQLNSKAGTATATTSANGLMSSTDKKNLTYFVAGTQTAVTNAWTGTLSGVSAPYDGLTIRYYLPYAGTSTGATLALNGGTAYPVYRYGVTTVTTHHPAGSIIQMTFRSSYSVSGSEKTNAWLVDSYYTQIYSNASLGQGYGTCATAAETTAKAVTLSSYSLSIGGVVAVKFTYAVPASATMNINSRGAKNIYHKGAAITAGVIDAGDIATFIYDGTQYHLLSTNTDLDKAKAYANTKADELQTNINTLDATVDGSIKALSVSGKTITYTKNDGTTGTITTQDTNTTYSAGTGISLSGTTFSNSGVRSIATGSSNGTISVNTNGTSANVAVKGLGSAAYTASSAYDAAGTAQTKANEALASAKTYADNAASKVKSDLLNGAGAAYDTLKELGDLINDNVDAIEALETVASGKADNKDMTGATADAAGTHGLVPAPAAGNQGKFLRGDGTWATPTNTTYSAAGSSLGLVKSGGDVTISSGVITVNDDSHNHTIANIDNLQTTIDTINTEIDGSIKALSVSGKTITYTKNDGTTGTITTQDTNTDTKVTQTLTSTSANYPLLLAPSGQTATATTTANFGTKFQANPSTGVLTATTFSGALSGNASSATKATQDASGNTITSTYETKTDASSKLTEAKTYTDTVASGKANSTHSHSDATTSAAGFMTAAMVTKLNGIATGANKTTVDASLSSTSTNPVQNKAVYTAISGLTTTVTTNSNTITTHGQSIAALQTAVNEFEEITSEEIQNLFNS